MSVAEDYYKNKPAQVLKGRVVKNSQAVGSPLGSLKYRNSTNTPQKQKNAWSLLEGKTSATEFFVPPLESDTSDYTSYNVCWSGLELVQERPAVNFHVSKY